MFRKSRIPISQMVTAGALPSPVQRRVYIRKGYKIGAGVRLAPGVVIDAEEVDIGAGASFGIGTIIRGRRVRIGRRVDVGAFCFFDGREIFVEDDTVVREQVFVGGPLTPESLFQVGRRVRVFQTCFLNPTRPLQIGDDTGVGGRSSIFTHGSWQSAVEGYPVTFAPVTIGRNVWLPWHVFILPGVEIGDDATIGAGSLVNRSIPGRCLAAGVPAKVLREPHEWPRRLGRDEKWSIARSMFGEFLAYVEDQGAGVSSESAPERVEASISYDGVARRLVLVRDAADTRPGDDVVVALSGLPRDTAGAAFSLLEKRKCGPYDEVSEEIEDFLARYGLRFQRLEEL